MRVLVISFLLLLGPALAAENPAGNARNPRLQEANLRLQLATATPAGIQAACGEILARPRSAATAGAYLVAVEILAEKTGASALAFARQHPFDPLPARALLEAFVRGWARSQPDAAEAWLKTATADVTDDDKLELAKVLLRIDAQTDGPRAMKRALRMAGATADPYSQRQNFALVVMESLVELGEFQQAREISTTLEPGRAPENGARQSGRTYLGLSAGSRHRVVPRTRTGRRSVRRTHPLVGRRCGAPFSRRGGFFSDAEPRRTIAGPRGGHDRAQQ